MSCCCFASSWLVCTGVLKPVLKPVLKLAWRCWVGRTPGTLLLSCCFVLVVLSLPKLDKFARLQLVAGVHGGAEAGAEASVALKPVLSPLSPNSYRPEAGVTVGIEIDIEVKIEAG